MGHGVAWMLGSHTEHVMGVKCAFGGKIVYPNRVLLHSPCRRIMAVSCDELSCDKLM